MGDRQNIRASILKLLQARQENATICPSEAARDVFDRSEWSARMTLVRDVAAGMASEGQIEFCQKGEAVDPATVRGPVRLRLK
ncbi:DUF3253 domain-containing protein [Coraliomargarita sinensis]